MPGDGLLVPTGTEAFGVIVSVVTVIVVLGFVAAIGTAVYRATRLTRRGVNPLTLQEDLATRALRSEALAPPRSKSLRLDEVDLLHGSGRISDDEHAAARARILAE